MNRKVSEAGFRSWAENKYCIDGPYDLNNYYRDLDAWNAGVAWQAAIASVSAQQVELTDDEITDIWVSNHDTPHDYTRAALAAQREKDKGAQND